MMLWIIIGAMLIAAASIIAIPMYRSAKRLTGAAAVSILAVAAISGFLYAQIGSPGADNTAASVPDVDEMVASLAARLQENPDDLAGWKMLGRSYVQLRNFPGAIAAFEKALALESGEDSQTMADLGEAILLDDGRTLNGRAGQLFENSLAIAPSNPKALFYSGMAAIERGDNELGATRWEALLATSPPPNIQDVLRQRIAELRGQAPPTAESEVADGPVVTVRVSLGDDASKAGIPDATVFVIARDPKQPAPPLAAVRRRVSELPADVPIGDADAMIPGRVPSAFANLEIVARVSLSGQPVAQSGDWFGQATIAPASADRVQIVIDQQVP